MIAQCPNCGRSVDLEEINGRWWYALHPARDEEFGRVLRAYCAGSGCAARDQNSKGKEGAPR